MGRSKKRKRTTGEQQHVDGGILPLLYPTSRLCTLHDLLLSLLLPTLQHHHAPTTTSEPLPPHTAGAGAHTQQVANKDAEHTLCANVDLPQPAMATNIGMRQAPVSAFMGVNIQPTVVADNVNMCMQQAAIAADVGANVGMQHAAMPINMGANMGFPQATIAVDVVGVQQVQASKVAMYIDACKAASTMPSKDMVAKQTALGPDLRWQQAAPTKVAMDKAAIAAAGHSLLVREGDTADYLHLLSLGYGVLPDTAPPLGHTMLEQRWTHQQVIERAIQILFRQGKNNSNVLCFGFQQPRPRSCLKRERTAPAGLACVSDNAAVAVLNSQTWRTIHARVGDLIMLHLLSYADIFQPLPHKCYVQVAGTSVLLFAQQCKTSEECAVPATNIPTDKQDASGKKQRVEKSKDTERGGGLVDFGSHMNARNRHYVTDPSMHHQVATRKRQRPHSWQRRKARKLYGKQAEQEGGFNVVKEKRIHMEPNKQEFIMRASEMRLASSLDIVEGCLATQEELVTVLGAEAVTQVHGHNNDKSHDNMQMLVLGESRSIEKVKNDWLNIPMPGLSSQQWLSCSAATISNDNTKVRKKQRTDGFLTRSLFAKVAFGTQQKQVRQGSKGGKFGMPIARSCITSGYNAGRGGGRRLINRTRMFYKAKFPHHAGLPKNHLLQRLRSSYKDTTILFSAIFGKESLCWIKSFGECHVRHSKTCSKCLFCLLKKLISNARHCQFSQFLKRHCSPCSTSHTQIKEIAKNLNFKVGMHIKKNANHDISDGRSDGVTNHAVSLQGACETPAGKSFDGTGKLLVEEENNSFSSHSQVVAFVWAVCRRIVPEELLGSIKNWRNLRRNIFAFVSLRRHESFSLEQCMFRLKLAGYPWCQEQFLDGCSVSKEATGISTVQKDDSKSNSQHASARGSPKNTNRSFQIFKRTLLEKWIYWLFSGLIVPVIQAHFYVTESEKYKQNVLFYRKSVWAKIKASAVKEMMKCNFKRLSVQSTVNLLKKGSLGFSRARLLPKKAGTRLIANLGSSSAIPANFACDDVGKVSKRRGKHGNHARKVDITKTPRYKKGLIFKPINLVLRDLHHCLKYEQEKHAEDLGCSVFDYNDAYLKLLPYIIGYKRASNAAAPLYLVVCDVLQAFDTIKQEKLIEIIQEFVREEEYCVMRYGYASTYMNSIKVFHGRSAMSTIKGMTSLDIFLQLAAKQRNAVCIDQAYAVKLKRSHIFEVLKEHILRNIIQIGQHFYLQIVGIPQGSILSSLLCSLYYGHFERSRLASTLHLEHRLNSRNQVSIVTNMVFKASSSSTREDFTSVRLEPRSNARSIKLYSVNGSVDSKKCLFARSNGTGGQYMPSPLACKCLGIAAMMTEDVQHSNIMLRLVDDWLFISNSQDDALEFVRKMHRGFIDYNCVANRLKTAVSFDAVLGGSTLNMNVYRTQDGACYIRWSGLLINCNTLEVQADYTRYCGVELRSTLTVWRRNNQGYYLMTKLCQFMRPKCHPIFYDTNINSPATVFLNAYQAFLLCAMKFHAYNCSLPCGSSCNPELGFRAIQKSARYMHSLLAHRTSKISKRSEVKPLLLLHAKEMQWLALCAFRKVLMRKQSRYVRLLYLIKTELQLPKYIGLGESPLMLSALDPRRSSMFEDIIY